MKKLLLPIATTLLTAVAVTPLINNSVKTNNEHKVIAQLNQQTNSKEMFAALNQKLSLNK